MTVRVQVAATAVQPYRFGLESVLQQRNDGGRWLNGGVEYFGEACGSAELYPSLCVDDAPDKTFGYGLPDPTGGNPFTIYSGFQCRLFDIDQARALVGRRLSFGEPRAVEGVLWRGDPDAADAETEGPLGALEPVLAVPDVVIGTLAASITAAVSQLERELAAVYGGIGVIHAPRSVMPYAAAANLIVRDGGVLRTPLDTMWAFGAGYEQQTGPAGETPPTSAQTWMYATGALARWRSDVLVVPPGDEAFGSSSNKVTVLAERTVALTRDCITIAVRATLG